MGKSSRVEHVAGLDVGDKWTHVCVMSMETGEVEEEGRVRTTRKAIEARFRGQPRMRIALEVGTHSTWMSRQLEALGHEVLVANAAKVALIYRHSRKHDRVDAKTLARLARFDPALLHPVRHRGPQAQADLAVVRTRDVLVRSRTQWINHVRGAVKSLGRRLPKCTAETFARKAAAEIPELLAPALAPMVETIATLTAQIRSYDRLIDELATTRYPETALLRQPTGVGALTSLAYVLTLDDKSRFRKSRHVGPYLGLVPKLDRSGSSDPQLRITREGDQLLRRLLVSSAQYILGPFGPDCDLRRYGERIAQRGGQLAKKKAVVAVARKLAVLLHHLWVTGEVYEPFYAETRRAERSQRRPAA